MTNPLQPGWYPDPSNSLVQRYWDGQNWGPVAPPPPSKQRKVPTRLLVILGGIAVLLIGASLAYFAIGANKPSEKTIHATLINACQRSVVDNLRDPGSAKFADDWTVEPGSLQDSNRSVLVDFRPEKGDKLYLVQGSVNAKNSFGGYVGNRLVGCDAYYGSDGKAHAFAQTIE